MVPSDKHKSVYVVEDDIELSTVFDRILKSIDKKIKLDWSTTAEESIRSVMQAKKKGAHRPYDLVIIDVFLDGAKSGIDLWKFCKKAFPDMPVILTTSAHLGALFPPDRELPEVPIFLQKPFSTDECKKLFKQLLT